MTERINKIRRKLQKLRLQPIRVFCLHHISDIFDESTMYKVDWMQTDAFKQEVRQLRDAGYTFISLEKVRDHIRCDLFRRRKYAVLTADDGWASITNILPWLDEQKIPITLFINPSYLDGTHFRDRETEKYLTWEELRQIANQYALVTIASHGWDHLDTTQQSIEVFERSVQKSIDELKKLPNYISFYAFPYGRYTGEQMRSVLNHGHVPVLVSGDTNYIRKNTFIDRELLGMRRKNYMQ